MSRILAVLAAGMFAAVLAVTGVTPVHAARASAPPPCAAGYVLITDNSGSGYSLQGTGHNGNILTAAGNCYTFADPQPCAGNTCYELENGYGLCVTIASNDVAYGESCPGDTTSQQFAVVSGTFLQERHNGLYLQATGLYSGAQVIVAGLGNEVLAAWHW